METPGRNDGMKSNTSVRESKRPRGMSLRSLKARARTARSRLSSGTEISLSELVSIVEDLLAAKDLSTAQQIFRQIPQSAYRQAPIVSLFLTYLVLCGETDQAARFARDLRASHPELPGKLNETVQTILSPLPDPERLPPPEIADYSFDLDDGHYRTEMLVHCRECGIRYLEKTGWGMMVLRPSYCPRCLCVSLISPDFLIGVMRRFHRHDGGRGRRKVDGEINRVVSYWHLEEELPEAATYHGVRLAEPLMLRVQRHLVREMFLERWVTGGEETP